MMWCGVVVGGVVVEGRALSSWCKLYGYLKDLSCFYGVRGLL